MLAQVQVLVTVVSASARAVAGADAVHDMTRPMDDGRWTMALSYSIVLHGVYCLAVLLCYCTLDWTGLYRIQQHNTFTTPTVYTVQY